MVWNPSLLRAVSEVETTKDMDLDMGLDFMEGFDEGRYETDFAGRLEIDMEMADVKAIDDGATIMGVLDEARRLQKAQDELRAAQQAIILEREKAEFERAKVASLTVEKEAAKKANAAMAEELATLRAQLKLKQPSPNEAMDEDLAWDTDRLDDQDMETMDKDGAAENGRGSASAPQPSIGPGRLQHMCDAVTEDQLGDANSTALLL